MNIDFTALEDLIHTSKYGTIKRFFEESEVQMTSQNYYKLKRTSGRIKGNHLQTICRELGCRLSDISSSAVLDEPAGSYRNLMKENELLRDLIEEKNEIIALLKDKIVRMKDQS